MTGQHLDMSHSFSYEYVFDVENSDNADDTEVITHVSYAFDTIAELESISTFPHRERREFTMALINKYDQNKYHQLDQSDITCPFAKRLQQLFQDKLHVYWTKRFRAAKTLVFLTGSY